MNAAQKIVTRLPLQELWREDAFVTASQHGSLTVDAIANLLCIGRVQFIVANVGVSLHWIPLGDCFEFWKSEVRAHLAAPESRAFLDEFPGGYCYFASEWSSTGSSTPIVVLEKHH